jgi:hypothetical protein
MEMFRNFSNDISETENEDLFNDQDIFKESTRINEPNLNDISDELNQSITNSPPYSNCNKENFKIVESELLNFDRNEDNYSDESDSVYGIRTNINAVREYIDLLIKHLLTNFIEYLVDKLSQVRLSEKKNYLIGFEGQTDMKYKCQRELTETKHLEVELSENGDSEEVWKRKTNKLMLLGEQIYLGLENKILSSYENMNINESLFNMQKVYHRCIFDSFNEIFSKLIRMEEDFDLSVQDKEMLRQHTFSFHNLEYLLNKTQIILLENVQEQCGMIKEKEDSLLNSVMKIIEPERYILIFQTVRDK